MLRNYKRITGCRINFVHANGYNYASGRVGSL